jgi:hypothetical protein
MDQLRGLGCWVVDSLGRDVQMIELRNGNKTSRLAMSNM